jgi:hypothetical protein
MIEAQERNTKPVMWNVEILYGAGLLKTVAMELE